MHSFSAQKMEWSPSQKSADGAISTMAHHSMRLHVSFTTAHIYKGGKDGMVHHSAGLLKKTTIVVYGMEESGLRLLVEVITEMDTDSASVE